MKKILCIMLLFITFNLSALDIGPIMGFRTSYNINYGGDLRTDIFHMGYDYTGSISLQVTTGIRLWDFRIIGIYENTLYQLRWDNYNPVQDNYTVKINYTFLDFEIGLSYTCNHPVSTKHDMRQVESNSSRRFMYLNYYKEF